MARITRTATSSQELHAQASSFPLQGLRRGNVHHFLGLPYGRAERFAYPQLVSLEDLPQGFEGRTPCPGAPQPSLIGVNEIATPAVFSEDCLRLSIATPRSSSGGEKLPVMVFLHGGSYVCGGGDAPAYDPQLLCSQGRTVVVKLNFRLGLLGFLGDGESRPANLGLCDVLVALEWIQQNIARFGGDPDRVTLFGQSAGADLIGNLLYVEGAHRLMRRAILHSAPLDLSSASLTQKILARTSRLALDAPVDLWNKAAKPYFFQNPLRYGLGAFLPLGCQLGHYPLPDPQGAREALGANAAQIELLVGNLPRESAVVALGLPAPLRPSFLKIMEPLVVGSSELVYGRSNRAFVRSYRQAGGRATYFSLETGGPSDSLASSHTSDLALLFENPSWQHSPQGREVATPAFREQAAALRHVWTTFARSGYLDQAYYKKARLREVKLD